MKKIFLDADKNASEDDDAKEELIFEWKSYCERTGLRLGIS